MDLLLTHGYFLPRIRRSADHEALSRRWAFCISPRICARAGFDVEIYDSTFGSREELFRILDTERPAVLGIYGNLMTRGDVLRYRPAREARGWRVVLGGPEPANYAAEYLDAGADVIVRAKANLPWKLC